MIDVGRTEKRKSKRLMIDVRRLGIEERGKGEIASVRPQRSF